MSISRWLPRTPGSIRVVILLLVLLIPGSLGLKPSYAAGAKAPVTITFWTWLPNAQLEVNLFEKAHPNIKVNLVNGGQGAPEYTKLRIALKAGTGAPDVVQIEFQYMPTFELTGKLLDMAKYGAGSVKDQFVPWTWAQVTKGSAIYAIPQDIGPMGLLYRADIFKKYNLSVPTTWAQFAQEAVALHKANPKLYLTDFPPTEGGAFVAYLWQAGVRPFKLNGTTLSIDFTSPAALQVANYWGTLVKEGAVATDADFTPAWNTGFAKGEYATWLTAAWGPVYLQSIAASSSGEWRVAPLPQWAAGDHANGSWGGSTDAVTTQTAHPQEATDLAVWINTNQQSTILKAQKQAEFPAIKSLLSDPTLTQQPWPFFGGQKIYSVFGPAASEVDENFQWSPFQDYVYTQLSNVLSAAVQGKTSYTQAMQTLQSTLVTYAKQQGFTVK